MSYNLRRVRDGEGDAGARSEAISWKDDGTFDEVKGNRPTLGCSILVGSVTARTYSHRDYWLTTEVTEICEEIQNDKTDYVRFKTGNSIYEWWQGEYPKTPEDRENYLKGK